MKVSHNIPSYSNSVILAYNGIFIIIYFNQPAFDCIFSGPYCKSGKELWLQGEAALQTPSFRDAEPQLVMPPKAKINYETPQLIIALPW